MKNRGLAFDWSPGWPEFAGFEVVGAGPGVVAGEVDMFPAKGREKS